MGEETSGIIELSPEHGFLDYHNDDGSTCQDEKLPKSGRTNTELQNIHAILSKTHAPFVRQHVTDYSRRISSAL